VKYVFKDFFYLQVTSVVALENIFKDTLRAVNPILHPTPMLQFLGGKKK
jgi:hypothetical protein